jgi:GAF domain-containing protein
MTILEDRAVDREREVAELRRRLDECAAELAEARAQQAATAEVLQVINTSPGDLAPVFDAILEKAHTLCGATHGHLTIYDGEHFRAVATHGMPEQFAELVRQPFRPGHNLQERLLSGEPIFHIPDMAALVLRPEDKIGRAAVELGGARTLLAVPLRKDDALLGYITAHRQEVRPFSDRQIALLQNFAAQAIIAMDNARLLTETREALEQQTATAEVLQVINSSPGDLAPVFDAMLQKAMHLCEAALGVLWTYDGDAFHLAASHGAPPSYAKFLAGGPRRPGPATAHGRLLRGSPLEHIADVAASEDYRLGDPFPRALVDLAGGRTILAVPLRKGGSFLGDIFIYRQEVHPFSDKHITLLQSFAAQAVIAMENARLLTETREALEQQTATADVLQVINSSPGDLAPVFDAILQRAHALCEASFGALMTYDGERFQPVASQRIPTRFKEVIWQGIQPNPADPFGCIVAGAPLSHIRDLSEVAAQYPNDPLPRAAVDLGGIRTLLVVPLRKDDVLLGVITAYRQEVRPFSDKQITLLQNFAAQAVVAMENARLITETREALEQQTAISDVLRVISGSAFDLAPVLETVVRTAVRLCRADQAVIYRNLEGEYRWAAGWSLAPQYERIEREARLRPGPGTLVGRAALEGRTVQIFDAWTDPLYEAKADARVGGVHTMLGVPLLRDGEPIGVIGLARRRIETYTEKEIGLVTTFADQAVIAIQNARLLTEIRAARDAAETTLGELQTAQASLVHAQKMAALGQLTAGIAHEIKNPLNFVNNFAGLSVELLDELKETAAPGLAALGDETRAEAEEIVATLTGNLEKIAEHGRRADGIVRSMLDHSRGGSNERRPVDVNALVEEALNLAYHGARAQDPDFNVALDRDLEADIAAIEVAPQDLTRVFLNLFGNGFYAADQRRRQMADPAFRPLLKVTTRDLGGEVEIRVRDNGTGIAPEIRDKLFQPFFTTKPTGEGTGLGLSISYDIVTQQHGGTIAVDSRFGEYTEFTIRLPRRANAAAG